MARRLILLCAPAGSGKTVVLSDWAPSGDRPVAWLSLDAADNDPVRFWRHVIAALDRVRPGIAGRAGPPLGPPAPSSFEGLVTVLINELDAQPGDGEVLLAAGTPNPRIAEELVVTVDTVKSTSATCWASSAPPTAPRRSPAPASSA